MSTNIPTLGLLANFLLEPPWQGDLLKEVANAGAQQPMSTDESQLVAADFVLTRALWQLLSLIDPVRSSPSPLRYAHFSSELRKIYAAEISANPSLKKQMIEPLAQVLEREAKRLLSQTLRGTFTLEMKSRLLNQLERKACWYCGDEFDALAIERFLHVRTDVQRQLPVYVDFVTLRATKPEHLWIEIDHVFALAKGGVNEWENLRLACGWCNRHKGALSLLTESGCYPELVTHAARGALLKPLPFWVVRTLATSRRCGAVDCPITSADEKLFVGPVNVEGAMVPGNLRAYCSEHDPLSDWRLVPNPAFK